MEQPWPRNELENEMLKLSGLVLIPFIFLAYFGLIAFAKLQNFQTGQDSVAMFVLFLMPHFIIWPGFIVYIIANPDAFD
ncbi:MAG: hypothetical protein JKX80_01305 [Candidatus Pacebacteria bacterium]|nr:hypothetical protein [Candidatus Paceibacterota bacterium]